MSQRDVEPHLRRHLLNEAQAVRPGVEDALRELALCSLKLDGVALAGRSPLPRILELGLNADPLKLCGV